MRLATDVAKVRVPATSGNLGPGFDSMGMAHDVWDEVEVRLVTGETRVKIIGEGEGTLATDDTHLVVRALRTAMAYVEAPGAGIEMTCRNRIPHGKGMGSSAAAVVAGLLLARGLIARPEALDNQTLLELATDFEGHPDNAAPAIYGGAVVSWHDGEHIRTAKLPVADSLRTTLLVPAEVLPTKEARAALPAEVPHKDAAFNAGRTALLVHALEHDPSLLFAATEDRLHQDYRASAMPHTARVLGALREAGWPAVISGAGPSILVFAALDPATAQIMENEGFHVVPSKQVAGAQLV